MPVLQRRPRNRVDDDDEPSQPPRRRVRRDDSDDDAESQASGQGGEHDESYSRDESLETQLIKKLVRYALACEYSRTPIRRDGIKDRVLGSHGRAFRKVFDGAQKQLRAVFGVEMVELPARDKDHLSLEEKRRAAKSQSKATTGSNSYILMTRLPEEYRAAEILAPSKVQSADDEAAYIGIYTMIVTIITLNGGDLSDAKLRRYLNRMNASENMPIDKTEAVLQRLVRQGYIVKTTERRNEGDEETITWHVGPRGKMEVGPEAVAGMVREVYGSTTDDLERKLQASLRIKPADGNSDEEDGEDTDLPDAAPEPKEINGAGEGSRRRSRRHRGDEDDG